MSSHMTHLCFTALRQTADKAIMCRMDRPTYGPNFKHRNA